MSARSRNSRGCKESLISGIESEMRREAPRCNSPGRKVGVNGFNKEMEARGAEMFFLSHSGRRLGEGAKPACRSFGPPQSISIPLTTTSRSQLLNGGPSGRAR